VYNFLLTLDWGGRCVAADPNPAEPAPASSFGRSWLALFLFLISAKINDKSFINAGKNKLNLKN